MVPVVIGTRLAVAGEKEFVPVESLKENAPAYYINENGRISIREIESPILVKDQPVVEVVFDTGDKLEIAQEIKVQLVKGNEFKRFLSNAFESLILFQRWSSGVDKKLYIELFYLNDKRTEHRLFGKYLDPTLTSKDDVHHQDNDNRNNTPSNLVIKNEFQHLSDHNRGIRNPRCFYSNDELKEIGKRLSIEKGRRLSTTEWLEAGYPPIRGKYRSKLGTFADFLYTCADEASVRNDPIPTFALMMRMKLDELGYINRFYGKHVEILVICQFCGKKSWKIYYPNHPQLFCSKSCSNSRPKNHQLITFSEVRTRNIYLVNLPNCIVGGWIKEDASKRTETGLIIC